MNLVYLGHYTLPSLSILIYFINWQVFIVIWSLVIISGIGALLWFLDVVEISN